MRKRTLVVALVVFLIGSAGTAGAEGRVERNVVFGMYSGLALLMDVYYPENPNGYGIVFISGSGWTRELGLDATPLKESGQEEIYAVPLAVAGYTVFGINHRASPRFRHPAHLEDAQRAVRFVRHHADEYGIDPDRIGAMGGSSGGHLVSLLGVLDGKGMAEDASPVNRESAKVQVVVARAAPTDLTLAAPGRVHPAVRLPPFRAHRLGRAPAFRRRIARERATLRRNARARPSLLGVNGASRTAGGTSPERRG